MERFVGSVKLGGSYLSWVSAAEPRCCDVDQMRHLETRRILRSEAPLIAAVTYIPARSGHASLLSWSFPYLHFTRPLLFTILHLRLQFKQTPGQSVDLQTFG